MAEMVFIKEECDIEDIKEEYGQEEDPLIIAQGEGSHTIFLDWSTAFQLLLPQGLLSFFSPRNASPLPPWFLNLALWY